jgi:hypothetical protein
MVCPACGEFEAFLCEHPDTERDCVYCIMCDWFSYEIPPFLVAMLIVACEDSIAEIAGVFSSDPDGPQTGP